jgi:hypothetical protein
LISHINIGSYIISYRLRINYLSYPSIIPIFWGDSFSQPAVFCACSSFMVPPISIQRLIYTVTTELINISPNLLRSCLHNPRCLRPVESTVMTIFLVLSQIYPLQLLLLNVNEHERLSNITLVKDQLVVRQDMDVN